MGNILIVAEHEKGKARRTTLELAGKCRELSVSLGGVVVAVAFGDGANALADSLSGYGVKKLITVSHADLARATGETFAKILKDVVDQEKPAVVLASASPFGKDLLARTAVLAGAGLAADCVDLKVESGKLATRRPIFAGKALVNVTPEGTPQMATLRPNTFPVPASTSGNAEVLSFPVTSLLLRATIKEVKEAERGMVDLSEADRIVSGGRSLSSSENFKIIRELAASIGATVGASRAAVDAGYISHDHQVGQTGKTVNPSLYIACGISGAIQHLAGMRTSKVIVAINKDPEAPIFSKADYGIVGDIFEIIPLLTQEFKKLLSE